MNERQAWFRACTFRRKFRCQTLQEFDEIFCRDIEQCPKFVDSVLVFTTLRRFLLVFQPDKDTDRFGQGCRYLLSSVLTPGLRTCQNYTSVAADKNRTVHWIFQQRKLLLHCSLYLKRLRPDLSPDHKFMMLCLNMILTFTNPHALQVPDEVKPVMLLLARNTLKDLMSKGLLPSLQSVLRRGLCRNRPCLSLTELSAIVTIATRPLLYFKGSDTYLHLFLVHILSVPALTLHLRTTAPDMLAHLSRSCPLETIFSYLLKSDDNVRTIFASLDGSYGLCLLANIIHLSFTDLSTLRSDTTAFTVSSACAFKLF